MLKVLLLYFLVFSDIVLGIRCYMLELLPHISAPFLKKISTFTFFWSLFQFCDKEMKVWLICSHIALISGKRSTGHLIFNSALSTGLHHQVQPPIVFAFVNIWFPFHEPE
jgi:hypothetical protein